MKNTKEEILSKLTQSGIVIFTKSLEPGRGSDIANTYAFKVNDQNYLIDTACGKKRFKEIKGHIAKIGNFDILCTHYHNDHIANNGRIASKTTKIIYHFNAYEKIRYLRTNGTGQILEMAKTMRLKPLLTRFKMFSKTQLGLIMLLQKISPVLPLMLLFITSYFYSLFTIGRISSGRSKVWILWEKYKENIHLDNLEISGWILNDGLYAFETPGHTDDHVMYYLKSAKTLFAGDSLNFLNPNDIQFGDIDETFRSFDFIEKFAKEEKIEILATGHYMPIIGIEKILAYIEESRKKHLEIYNTVKNIILSKNGPIDLEELFSEITSSESSDLIHKVAKLTFPRSTLIFLDVFILKTLKCMNYRLRPDGFWELNTDVMT